MKRLLSMVAVLACVAVSGCAIVPAGPYYEGGPGVVLVAPAIAVPAPRSVGPYGHPGRGAYGGGWRRRY
jgi:hypothetical protein